MSTRRRFTLSFTLEGDIPDVYTAETARQMLHYGISVFNQTLHVEKYLFIAEGDTEHPVADATEAAFEAGEQIQRIKSAN